MNDAVVVELGESVDAAAVRHAREVLASAPARTEIVLDLTRARDIDWHALATIARGPPAPVVLRGLCDHHLKLLRYLS